MEKHTIGGLKKILVASSHFYEIQDYFLTLTETNMAAIEGKAGKNKVLKEIIAATLKEICLRQDLVKEEERMIMVNMMMVEVRERYFWHGSGMMNGKNIFSFFYFADLDKGMISVSKGSMNFFARVSIKSAPNQEGNPTEAFSEN
jgi:hypothetical protein